VLLSLSEVVKTLTSLDVHDVRWGRDAGCVSIGEAPVLPGFVCLGAGRTIAVHRFVFC
jgi:hypothetical protein